MALHKSLRRKSRLVRQRSVLNRAERIAQMKTDEKWADGSSPFGLPKLRVVRTTAGRKKKKEEKKDEAGAAEGAAPAAGAKAAPAAKGAAKGGAKK